MESSIVATDTIEADELDLEVNASGKITLSREAPVNAVTIYGPGDCHEFALKSDTT